MPGGAWSCSCLPDPPAAAPLTEGHCVAMGCGTAQRCPTTLLQCPYSEAAGGCAAAEGVLAQPSGMTQAGACLVMMLPAGPLCQRRPSCGLRSSALAALPVPQASLQGHFSEAGWVGHCRGSAGTAHCITPAGIPGRTAACRAPLQRRPSCGLRSNALAAVPVPQPS